MGPPGGRHEQGPLNAILGLWRAGEHLSAIVEEFAMAPIDVEQLIQAWDRVRDTAA
jgi:hypothetical protein